jgi:hypothetical protein
MLCRGCPRFRLTFLGSTFVGLGRRLSALVCWPRLVRLRPLARVNVAAPSDSFIGVSRTVQLILFARIAEWSFTTARCLPFPTRQTRSSNAPSLGMWCAVICDESQRLFWLLAGRRGMVVVCGMCTVHLDDVHDVCYLRRFWSLQARWLEECALRWPPFHICVWFTASGLIGEGKRVEGMVQWTVQVGVGCDSGLR